MSNNQNNSGSGQLNLPLPTPSINTTPPSGGWHVFQTSSFPYTIYIDGGAGGGGSAAPVEEKKINKDGCKCKKCKEMYPYADPPDPEKFICYSCRHHY